MEEFDCTTKIISGTGTVNRLAEFGAKRIFLVTDPYFYENGTAQQVAEWAKAEEMEIFSEVRPDPTVELAARGTARLRAFRPDLIVALGGGSTMDCAKAMACFAGGNAKLAAIPTTSGSGSEVTDFAILTHKGIKHPLIDRRLRPDMAILDSRLLQQLPASLVADAGFDVIAHALEAYVAKGAGEFSDAMAAQAFRMACQALPASFAGRKQVRLTVHQASTMAGLAFSHSGLGLCHAMSHALGGIFHVPHGRLNAILLPGVVGCNAHVAGEKYARLAREAGLGGSAEAVAVRNLKNALLRLRRELKLPETLAQAGVEPREVWANGEKIVEAALGDPCCAANPMPVEAFVVQQILEEVTGRV